MAVARRAGMQAEMRACAGPKFVARPGLDSGDGQCPSRPPPARRRARRARRCPPPARCPYSGLTGGLSRRVPLGRMRSYVRIVGSSATFLPTARIVGNRRQSGGAARPISAHAPAPAVPPMITNLLSRRLPAPALRNRNTHPTTRRRPPRDAGSGSASRRQRRRKVRCAPAGS